MTTTGPTWQELLDLLPQMDYRNIKLEHEGQPITPEEGIEKLKDYDDFKKQPPHDLKDQTISVGFNSEKLITWLQQNKSLIDEVKVFMAFDKTDQKFTVVLWPYKAGRPATEDASKDDSALLSPYNIGGRQPIM